MNKNKIRLAAIGVIALPGLIFKNKIKIGYSRVGTIVPKNIFIKKIKNSNIRIRKKRKY